MKPFARYRRKFLDRHFTQKHHPIQLIFDQIWEKSLILFSCLCVLLPTSPLNMVLTHRDSGVFLYIGWRILNGELPYRDVWDHKPPVIFYLNALGLAITNQSRWGVWLIELTSLFLAVALAFHLLKKAFGIFPAIYSLLLGLLTLTFIIQGGNLTTEYTLSLQFFALWLAYDIERLDLQLHRWFLIGVTGAFAFFTKQTAIGIWLAIILCLTFIRLKQDQAVRWVKEILALFWGALTITIFIVVVFGIQGTLLEFWDAAFKYNFAYSSAVTNFANRLSPILIGIESLTKVGLFQFSMIGYVIGIILLIFRTGFVDMKKSLLLIGVINLPIELVLVSISAKTFPHYYMCMLPSLCIFSGIAFWTLLSWVASLNLPDVAKSFFKLSVIGIFLWASFSSYRNQVVAYAEVKDTAVINYVKSHVAPDDYVLLWGAESSVNFFARRESPSRFIYQYPLYTRGYVDEQMVLEFLEDIIQNQPYLIIDTKNPQTPMYEFSIHTETIQQKIIYLKSQYQVVENLEDWTIYQRIQNTP